MPLDPAPAPSRRYSRLTKVVFGLIALGIALAIAAGVFLFVGAARVSSRLDAIRARGEPVMPADIQFESAGPSSALHEKGDAFHAAIDASPDFFIETPDLDEVKAWTPIGERVADVQSFQDCVYSSRSEGRSPGDFDWDTLVVAMWDPEHSQDLSECERLGLKALGVLREPLVSAAKDACAVNPVTAATEIHALRVDEFEPDMRDFMAPCLATRTLVESMPARVLAGDYEEAMRRLEFASQGSAAISGLPWYIGHLAWCMSANQVLSGCKCVLANAPRPLDWHVVQDRLEHMQPIANLDRGLVGERTFGIKMFRALHDGSFGGTTDAASMRGYGVFALFDSFDFALYLDRMSEELDRVRVPLPHPDSSEADSTFTPRTFHRWAPVTALLLPKLPDARAITIKLEAERRLAVIAIEANVHGAEAATKMAASVADPFDGKPMRTRVDSGVFSAWSVGPDRLDQGGTSERPSPKSPFWREHSLDLVWRVRLN